MDDGVKEVKPSRSRKDRENVKKIEEFIVSCHNPFSPLEENMDVLINISTGKAVSMETANAILNIREAGRKARDAFVQKCSEDPAHFESPIKKLAIRTFASDCADIKVNRNNQVTDST